MKPLVLVALALGLRAQTPDWPKVNEETLRHYQALIQIDSTDPPGNETRVVDYVKKVLDAEGAPYITGGREPSRLNLVARLKGNGAKRPIIIMGHSDTVKVDAAKWSFPPFSAARNGGYIY